MCSVEHTDICHGTIRNSLWDVPSTTNSTIQCTAQSFGKGSACLMKKVLPPCVNVAHSKGNGQDSFHSNVHQWNRSIIAYSCKQPTMLALSFTNTFVWASWFLIYIGSFTAGHSTTILWNLSADHCKVHFFLASYSWSYTNDMSLP